MKRPWHFWLLYVVCVSIVVVAMAWLSTKAMELDHSEARARRQAELEQAVSRALWRIDVTLIPLLAREAARPHSAYRSYTQRGVTGTPPPATPLQTARPEFVWLNFQCDQANRWSSPLVPDSNSQEIAIRNGAKDAEITASTTRLAQLRQKTSYDQLAALLPTEMLEPIHPPSDFTNSTPKMSKVIKGAVENQQFGRTRANWSLSSNRGIQLRADQQGGAMTREQAHERGQEELENRDAAVQAYAQNVVIAERNSLSDWSTSVREGVSQPLWVDTDLLLARRVELQEGVLIQGCWLNWPGIRALLLEQIRDLLPDAKLAPVKEGEQVPVGRMLATLPVRLVASPLRGRITEWSAMRIALVTAWVCLFIAVVALALLSQGVLALSERRGAFVSSVTHELRTPLTTFRMYSEMLARDMVPDAEKRRQYLETLRVEADRLSHLVENVLAYARIERGSRRSKPEQIEVAVLIDRVERRLYERAQQAGMEFVAEADEDVNSATLSTDPAAVEQILFNLVDNACKYAASATDRRIHLEVSRQADRVSLCVRDHGDGVEPNKVRQLFRPFSKSADDAAQSAAGVGLGLALCRRIARELGGNLRLDTNRSQGAAFVLELGIDVAGVESRV